MTEQEKRHKVEKIEKYKDQISKLKKEEIKNRLLAPITALLAVISFKYTNISINTQLTDIENIIFFTGAILTTTTISLIENLITSIAKKINLESKIEDLNEELGIEEPEEKKSRGVKRLWK